MNAVIYARYSSDSQREESIEGQLRDCMAFAENKGLSIVNTYIDRALSAKTDNRPQFQQMIKDSLRKKFEVVLVWKLDRFSRNRYDSAHYKARLKMNGVNVVSATESIAQDASGILLEALLEGSAEYFSADLSEKVRRGQSVNANKCMYNGGGVPVGYFINKEQFYDVDNLTAPIVVEAFKRYRDGCTMKSLVDYFNLHGIKNYRGNDMSIDSVKSLLKNRRYLGEYIYSGTVIPDGVPRIIDDELFYAVQERIARNKKAPARHKAKQGLYLLTTKLMCGKCGAYMVGESGTSRNGTFHQYYKCSNVKNHKGCDKKTVRKAWIEDIVINEATKLLLDDVLVNDIVNRTYEFQLKENTVIPQLKKQISETNRAIDNMIKAIEQGIITKSTKDRLAQLEQTKEDLSVSLANEEIKKPIISKEMIEYWILRFRELDMSKPDSRQALVDSFVNGIYLYDDKITFVFNYREGSKSVNLADLECSELGGEVVPKNP